MIQSQAVSESDHLYMSNIREFFTAGYMRIRHSFFQNFNLISLLSIPAIIYTFYLVFGILGHTFLDVNIPNEYREAANVLLTKEFIKGNNPYSLSALQGDVPPMVYLYGPLYSVIVALLGVVFRIDIVLLHYLVTFTCIVASSLLAASIVKEHSRTITASILAFLFLINCHWRYSYVNAVPDSLGLFMMVLILYLLSRPKMKYKAVICAVLSVLIFFSKQYFLLIAGTATAYIFLFESKKESFKYLATMALTAGGLAGLIQWKFPLFWTYMIYLAKGPGKGVAGTVTRGMVKMSGEAYNFQQIMSIGGMFLFFFIAATVGVLYCIFKKKLEKIDYLMFGHMAVAGICLLYIGKNDGAWLSYYLELFVPALIIEALILVERLCPKPSKSWKYIAFVVFYTVMFCFTAYRTDTRLKKSQMTAEDYGAWAEAQSIMSANSEDDMYLYPLLAYFGIKNDKYVYNTGQPFVITEKFYKRYMKSESAQEKFPYAKEIFEKHLDYRADVKERVRKGDFSLVTYIDDYDVVFDETDLSIKYEKARTLTLRAGRWTWDVQFWTLK